MRCGIMLAMTRAAARTLAGHLRACGFTVRVNGHEPAIGTSFYTMHRVPTVDSKRSLATDSACDGVPQISHWRSKLGFATFRCRLMSSDKSKGLHILQSLEGLQPRTLRATSRSRDLYRLHNGVNRVYSDKVRRLPRQAVF